MRHLTQGRHGQSTAEYAVVIALVLGAVVGMQTYVRRAINARISGAVETKIPCMLPGCETGVPTTGTANTQYDPYYATSATRNVTRVGDPKNLDNPVIADVKDTVDADGISEVTGPAGGPLIYASETVTAFSVQSECGMGEKPDVDGAEPDNLDTPLIDESKADAGKCIPR